MSLHSHSVRTLPEAAAADKATVAVCVCVCARVYTGKAYAGLCWFICA